MTILNGRLHARIEHDIARRAACFRFVHRGVGVAQDVLRLVILGIAADDPDAHRRVNFVLAQLIGGLKILEQSGGHYGGVLRLLDAVQ